MPAKSQAQQKFMGMVHALNKGDIKPSDVSKSVRDVAKTIKKSDAKDFASTKHNKIPRKVKEQLLTAFKEYAAKMGRDNLGGDDYTSKRKGGLRDFDGYDNVDYNKDMPQDEGFASDAQRRAAFASGYKAKGKKGKKEHSKYRSLSYTNEGIDGLKNAQSRLKKVYKHLGVEYGETRRGDKYVQINYIPKSSPQSQQPEFVKVFYDDDKELQKIGKTLKLKLKESVNEGKHDYLLAKVADTVKGAKDFMSVGKELKKAGIKYSFSTSLLPIYRLDKLPIAIVNKKYAKPNKAAGDIVVGDMVIGLMESVNEASRGEIFKAAKRGSYPATVVVSQVRDMKSKVIKQVTVKTPAEAPATIKVLQKKYPKGDYKISLEDRTGKIIYKESMNEGPIDRVVGGRPYNYVGDGRKGKVTVSGPLKDRERKDILKRAKKAGYSAAPGIKGGVVIHVESIYEGMFSTLDQIRKDSKDVRDFVKNVFKDRDFMKMKNDKEFIKYLKSIYEGVDESKGVPQNYMQGRTSDYHTALRGKNRDYSGGTNFKKKDHGHPDIEKDDEDQETNALSVKQTKLKEEMGNLSSAERIELYKLYSKAMKAMPGSPNQKKIKVLINKLRKKADLKPLPEYGQRLDLSYLEDMEAKLKGTPKPKDAIDRNIDEYSGGSYEYTKGDQYGQNSVNEIGVFPVQNYVDGIIPSSFIDTTTKQKKERLKSTLRNLKSTLNHFWKQHNIPYRIR